MKIVLEGFQPNINCKLHQPPRFRKTWKTNLYEEDD